MRVVYICTSDDTLKFQQGTVIRDRIQEQMRTKSIKGLLYDKEEDDDEYDYYYGSSDDDEEYYDGEDEE